MNRVHLTPPESSCHILGLRNRTTTEWHEKQVSETTTTQNEKGHFFKGNP
jgi:hypothetical protein